MIFDDSLALTETISTRVISGFLKDKFLLTLASLFDLEAILYEEHFVLCTLDSQLLKGHSMAT